MSRKKIPTRIFSTTPLYNWTTSYRRGRRIIPNSYNPYVAPTPLAVTVENDTLKIGNVTVSFQRTLRIPDDGGQYPLPPSLGTFPIRRVEDYAGRVPASWLEHGGVFMPMFQREAMWMKFGGASWRPNALKVGIGKVNALSGKEWKDTLKQGKKKQDYLVVPDQPWLDGINAGDGIIKQFVAMPMGMGYTVEGQVTGKEEHGGLQISVFDPKPFKFPNTKPDVRDYYFSNATDESFYDGCFGGNSGPFMDNYNTLSAASSFSAGPHSKSLGSTRRSRSAAPSGQTFARMAAAPAPQAAEMGLAAGGQMTQKIYRDKHGVETWDQSHQARVFVHLVNAEMWTQITGERMPESPVTRDTYKRYGYTWYDLYDSDRTDVKAPKALKGVKSVKEKDQEHGFAPQQDDSTIWIPGHKVHKTTPGYSHPKPPNEVSDGNW